MAVQPQHLVEQFLAEAIHHRHDDDQRGDAEHDAEEGEAGDHRDEALPPAGAQIAERHHPFEGREGPCAVGARGVAAHAATLPGSAEAVRRCKAASKLSVCLAPMARSFNSTSPALTLFGPTISCQGSPIRSKAANLAPSRSS